MFSENIELTREEQAKQDAFVRSVRGMSENGYFNSFVEGLRFFHSHSINELIENDSDSKPALTSRLQGQAQAYKFLIDIIEGIRNPSTLNQPDQTGQDDI